MIGTWRQQQAQEALQDHLIEHHGVVTIEAASAIADAVEIATTVKTTQDASDQRITKNELVAHLTDILTALGFEVVQ